MTASLRTIASADQPFVVLLEGYSGPLDLLLHLIREQEIDIADIPIARIANQFLEAMQELALNEAADYLEMAAQLLRLKILMLLPRPFDEEAWEDPRAELVRRLLEYEQIREVADWFADEARAHAERFPRGWLPDPHPHPHPHPHPPLRPPPPVVVGAEELLAALERVLEAMPQPMLHRVVPRPLDVECATRRITALLEQREKLDFLDLVGEQPTVTDILSALIAVLELARLGRLRLAQRRPFGSVTIRREATHTVA